MLGVFGLFLFGLGGGVVILLGARFLLMPRLAGKTIVGEELVNDVEVMVFLRICVIVVQRLCGCVKYVVKL
jgi:hypothetical protein